MQGDTLYLSDIVREALDRYFDAQASSDQSI